MSDATAPPGFVPLPDLSPYVGAMGPLYVKEETEGPVIGLRVAEKHLNTRGFLHGAAVCGLADIAMAVAVTRAAAGMGAEMRPLPLVTANLSVDFAGTARVGDWIECRVDVQRHGGRLAFANAYIWRSDAAGDGERIARASAIFARAASA